MRVPDCNTGTMRRVEDIIEDVQEMYLEGRCSKRGYLVALKARVPGIESDPERWRKILEGADEIEAAGCNLDEVRP